MNETDFFQTLVIAWFVLAGLTFVFLFFVKAPYGRYTRKGWGPLMDRRWGWILMETPSALLMLLFFLIGSRTTELLPILFLVLWEIHYFHRSFIYPFQVSGRKAGITLAPVILAIFFNTGNAYINGRWLFSLGPGYSNEWLTDPRFITGMLLFVTGFAICKHSDHILGNLRKPGETGYKIPQGGMFRLVSCPNYLGEIIEWTGWAVATWSLAGLTFAVWTFANLAPRAVAHHRWYRKEFTDYPRGRRAVIPFIL